MLLQRKFAQAPATRCGTTRPSIKPFMATSSPSKLMTAATLRSVETLPSSAVTFPPHKELLGAEKGSFAEGTITKRLPAIISSMLSDVAAYAKTLPPGSDAAKQVEAAIAEIALMREEMLANKALGHVSAVGLPPAGGDECTAEIVAHTNAVLDTWVKHSGTATWLGLPWLIIECYMYVRISAAIRRQPALAAAGFDPFGSQKRSAFVKSQASVSSMAAEVEALVAPSSLSGAKTEALKEKLFQVMQYSLWGNKTDLSLLVDASKIDPAALAVGGGSNAAGQPFLIVDEFEAVWGSIQRRRLQPGSKPPRIDIILDNTGLELYGDLCLADFLLASGLAGEVVLHGKPLPWFVSDTMRQDLADTLAMCCERPQEVTDAKIWEPVQRLGARWKAHLDAGRIRYTQHAFWCTPDPFCWMKAVSPDLHADLASSSLLIFKGDLNYRKLSYDCRWPWTSPFSQALMGFHPAPLLTLRTLKADVIAGLKPGQGEALGKVDPDWQVNGKFGIIQAHI